MISIRYRNDLPPPPMPPKLLEIDTGGLQQYLDPGFAASIAKREEPNIEADAEGGMPIDVIGMYGYFDGDESSIMAPDVAPPLDPDDEALMLTPEQLKAGGAVTGSNFLRKTQYMTAGSARATDPSTAPPQRVKPRPKPQVLARDDKENIIRNIRKGFDLAYSNSKSSDPSAAPISQAERQAWEKPIHPTNKNLRPVSFHPVLPDFDANTAIGNSWNLLRFDKPPLPALKSGPHPTRDNRLDAAFLVASAHPEKITAWEKQKKAHDDDPKNFDDPGNKPTVWSLLLPNGQASAPLIRRVMNSRDPEHDFDGHMSRVAEPDESDHNRLKIPFDRTRFYANTTSQDKDFGLHPRQVVLSLTTTSGAPSAQYYPIAQANKLMSNDRAAKLGSKLKDMIDDQLPDQIMVEPTNLNHLELANRTNMREEYDPRFASRYAEIFERAQVEQAEIEKAQNGAVGVEAQRSGEHRGDIEMGDADADGDDD